MMRDETIAQQVRAVAREAAAVLEGRAVNRAEQVPPQEDIATTLQAVHAALWHAGLEHLLPAGAWLEITQARAVAGAKAQRADSSPQHAWWALAFLARIREEPSEALSALENARLCAALALA